MNLYIPPKKIAPAFKYEDLYLSLFGTFFGGGEIDFEEKWSKAM